MPAPKPPVVVLTTSELLVMALCTAKFLEPGMLTLTVCDVPRPDIAETAKAKAVAMRDMPDDYVIQVVSDWE